jgi:hypothetical protein
MHRQIAEIEVQSVALELSRQPIGARVDHVQADQIVQILQVIAVGLEGRVDCVEIEGTGQNSLTLQLRPARALGIEEVIGALMTRGAERVALDLERGGMSVQIALAPNPHLCAGRWAFRGCDALELEMPASIVEGHMRARYREAAHDG